MLWRPIWLILQNVGHSTVGKIPKVLFVLVFYLSIQSEIWPNFHILSISTPFLIICGWDLRSAKTAITWLAHVVTSGTLSQDLSSSSKQISQYLAKNEFQLRKWAWPDNVIIRSWCPSGVIGESLVAMGHSVRALFAFSNIVKQHTEGKQKAGGHTAQIVNRIQPPTSQSDSTPRDSYTSSYSLLGLSLTV